MYKGFETREDYLIAHWTNSRNEADYLYEKIREMRNDMRGLVEQVENYEMECPQPIGYRTTQFLSSVKYMAKSQLSSF